VLSFRTICRNIFSNWAGFIVHALIAFFLTPFVLHQLGDARYGVWALVMSITGYYGLIDLGLRSGLTQYITRYLARQDYDQMNRSASTGFVVLALLGLIVFLTSCCLAFAARLIFKIPIEVEAEVAWCIFIVGSGTAVQFWFFPFSSVFVATQRYDLSNAIGIFTRVLTALAIVGCLTRGYGLVAVSLATAISNLVDYLLRWRIAKRILPQFRISPRLFGRAYFREFVGYGTWTFICHSTVQAAKSSGPIIIGLFLPIGVIGKYSLALTAVKLYEGFLGPAARVFYPVATNMDATGDIQGLRRVYITGTRMLLLVAILIGFLGNAFATDFFRLWIGEKALENAHGSIPGTFRVLLLSAAITASQSIGAQILFGRREVRKLAWMACVYATTYLVLSVGLTPRFGIMGVALAAAISAFVVSVAIYPYVCCRCLGLTIKQYAREAYVRPVVLLILLLQFHWFKDAILPQPTTWLTFALMGLATFVPALALAMVVVLTPSERSLASEKIMKRFRRNGSRWSHSAPLPTWLFITVKQILARFSR